MLVDPFAIVGNFSVHSRILGPTTARYKPRRNSSEASVNRQWSTLVALTDILATHVQQPSANLTFGQIVEIITVSLVAALLTDDGHGDGLQLLGPAVASVAPAADDNRDSRLGNFFCLEQVDGLVRGIEYECFLHANDSDVVDQYVLFVLVEFLVTNEAGHSVDGAILPDEGGTGTDG